MISLAFILTCLAVCIVPGVGVVYTAATALGRGRAAGLAAATGCTFGPLPHLTAAILGLAAVLHTSAVLYSVLKWAGVAYLLWLAYGALKGGGTLNISPDRRPGSLVRIGVRGALLNVLNPKLSIFFLALLPPFLSGNPATATQEMIALGAVFMAVTFAVFAVYAIFAAAARDAVLTSEKAMAWLNRTIAGAMGLLAAKLATERI